MNPIQQASVRRKIVYLVAIAGLFTLSIFWRGKLAFPFSNQVAASKWLTDRSVFARADRLEMRELDQGDAEVLGSVLRLGLTGSRGLVVTGLWMTALEKQKRNEWHEFEMAARAVTRLQPNFISPWIFQSWNIAYNVSVENDKLSDMYFYIARGIELLAEGDRLNTKVLRTEDGKPDKVIGSPDIRYQAAFYYQNKFGVSDKVQTLRCLMQLSGIPPAERAAQRDAAGKLIALPLSVQGRGIDPAAFREFCERHPQLVRRLRTRLNLATPEEVAQFLADNEKVPGLYKAGTELADPADQFPVLPLDDNYPGGGDEYLVDKTGVVNRTIDDTFDAYHAARAWFGYANAVVPPNKTDRSGQPLPWASPRPTEYDQFRYRMPRSPALIIFRQQPARAQTYLAERLAKEGWFDETSGWAPDDRAGASTAWFPQAVGGDPVVLKTPANAKAQWDRAWRMWGLLGEQTALSIPAERLANLREMARKVPNPTGGLVPDLTPEQLAANDLTQDEVDAAKALTYLDQNRSITNFDYFLTSTEAERDDLTVAARRTLWEADNARQSAENARAVRLYTQGLAQWREVLRKFKRFHRPERSDTTEEYTYEIELALISLLKEDGAVRARADRVAEAYRGLIPALPDLPDGRADVLQAVAEDEAGTRVAAEAMGSTFLTLGTLSAERRAVQRANLVADTAAALGGPLGTDPVRPTLLRGLIDTEFAWMKDRKAEPKFDGAVQDEDYWVRPYLRESVKLRLGLIRRAAPTGPLPPAEGESRVDAPEPPTPPAPWGNK
jgi:hypothetical protein